MTARLILTESLWHNYPMVTGGDILKRALVKQSLGTTLDCLPECFYCGGT